MQVIMAVFLMLAGLWLALLADAPGQMEIFGWVLVLVGVLALVARSAIARRRSPP